MAETVHMELSLTGEPPLSCTQSDLKTVCWLTALAQAAGEEEWSDEYGAFVGELLEARAMSPFGL